MVRRRIRLGQWCCDWSIWPVTFLLFFPVVPDDHHDAGHDERGELLHDHSPGTPPEGQTRRGRLAASSVESVCDTQKDDPAIALTTPTNAIQPRRCVWLS